MKKFILAWQFLTVIPLNKNYIPKENELAKSVIYFPFVGFLIGFFLILSFKLFYLFFSFLVVSCFILATEIFLTCGFHLDGLLDTFDGIFSGFKNKEKILQIMKDPRAGGVGVIFLFLFLLLKFCLISELFTLKHNIILNALILMPVLGRWAPVLGMKFFKPVKTSNLSLGTSFSGIGNLDFFLTNIFIILISLIFLKVQMLFVLIFLFSSILLFFAYVNKIIGGITGDVLGASCEISEVIFLIIFIILNR